MLSEEQLRAVKKCELFSGLSDEGVCRALVFFCARIQNCKKGACLHSPGDEITRFGLVLCGTVQVFFDDASGCRTMMAGVSRGETFGESLCWLRLHDAPVYICAAEAGTVLWLSCDGIFDPSDCSGEALAFSRRFVSMLARRALGMNDRIQVLSKKTLREKLLTLFSQYSARVGSTFRLPMNREQLAVYLGANRSALSRELSLLQKEGVIEYYKSSFKLL